MSDKLFKNDLTPSACQSDGNLGQAVAGSTIFLPSPPSPPHPPGTASWTNPPKKRNVLGDDVAH